MRVQPSTNVPQIEKQPAAAPKAAAQAAPAAQPAATVQFSQAALRAAGGDKDHDGDSK
jgi:hypothetical protein